MCASCCNYMEEAAQAERCKRKALGHWLVQNIFTVEIAERLHHSGLLFIREIGVFTATACGFFGTKITHQDSVFLHVSLCLTAILASFGQAPSSSTKNYRLKLSSDTPVRFLQPAWFTSWIPKSRESLEEVRPAWLCIAQTHHFWGDPIEFVL